MKIPAGDDLVFEIAVTRDGAPVDLTNAEAKYVIDGQASKTLTPGGGITRVAGETGVLEVRVPAAEMVAIPPGKYRHEMKVRVDGVTETVLMDSITIQQSLIGADLT